MASVDGSSIRNSVDELRPLNQCTEPCSSVIGLMYGVQIDIDFRTLCDISSYNQCNDALFVKWPLLASKLVQLVDKKYAVKGLFYFIMWWLVTQNELRLIFFFQISNAMCSLSVLLVQLDIWVFHIVEEISTNCANCGHNSCCTTLNFISQCFQH